MTDFLPPNFLDVLTETKIKHVHYAATEFCTLVGDSLLDRYSKKLGITIFVFTTRSLLSSGFILF